MTFNPSRRQVFARSFSTRESTLVSQATFFGPKPPVEVNTIIPLLSDLEKSLLQRILQFVLEYMKGTEVCKLQAKQIGLIHNATMVMFFQFTKIWILIFGVDHRVPLVKIERESTRA
jgi:hypothetical protein